MAFNMHIKDSSLIDVQLPRALITGTSRGIGRAIAEKFLSKNIAVFGFDVSDSSIRHENYHHFKLDVRDKYAFPPITGGVHYIINNAGVQNTPDDIAVNLQGAINITERYAFASPELKSVLMISSASAHTGAEFPAYAASKGGLNAYTKNVAMRLASVGATCNSLDPGGVYTELNAPVVNDAELFAKIMDETPLRRWASAEEMAEWAYFLTVKQSFATAQNILVDGGEAANNNFIWTE